MKLSERQQLFARDVVKLLLFMDEKGYKYTFGETMRTREQAEIYVKQGKGILNSLHCQRLAIDINVFNEKGKYLRKSEDYRIFADYWESLSPANRNGIRFKRKDANHFERNGRLGL